MIVMGAVLLTQKLSADLLRTMEKIGFSSQVFCNNRLCTSPDAPAPSTGWMPTVESAILTELYFHQIALRWSAVPGSGSGDMRKLNNSIIRFRKQAAKMLRIPYVLEYCAIHVVLITLQNPRFRGYLSKQVCQVLKALQYYFAKFSSLLLVSGHEVYGVRVPHWLKAQAAKPQCREAAFRECVGS